MALTRAQIKQLAAGTSSGPAVTPVHLPVLDEDLFVARLGRTARQEVTVWAASELGLLETGEGELPEDLSSADNARLATLMTAGALRFALVDGHNRPLLESFEEALGLFENLDERDWQAISDAFGQMRPDPVVEDVEAGKASSKRTRKSSGSTT